MKDLYSSIFLQNPFSNPHTPSCNLPGPNLAGYASKFVSHRSIPQALRSCNGAMAGLPQIWQVLEHCTFQGMVYHCQLLLPRSGRKINPK
jgi:hypothetical protein